LAGKVVDGGCFGADMRIKEKKRRTIEEEEEEETRRDSLL